MEERRFRSFIFISKTLFHPSDHFSVPRLAATLLRDSCRVAPVRWTCALKTLPPKSEKALKLFLFFNESSPRWQDASEREEPWPRSILELQPTHFAVCFDAKGKTFRHEMFTDYKANRPPTPPELQEAIPKVIDMVRCMGVPLLMVSGVEADDIIGVVAKRSVESGLHVSVVSPDKDFFQLLGPRVRQLRPNGKNYKGKVLTNREGGGDGFGDASHQNLNTKGLVPYTERDFRDEFMDLDPRQFIDLLAMMGDSSDNIPGVGGVGAKTAPKLLVWNGRGREKVWGWGGRVAFCVTSSLFFFLFFSSSLTV